jgi:hypothetical protein
MSIRLISDGGFILAGQVKSLTNLAQVYIIRADSIGDTLWTRNYGFGNANLDEAYDIQENDVGEFVIAGDTQSLLPAYIRAVLLKTTAFGDTIWSRSFENGTELFNLVLVGNQEYVASGKITHDNGLSDVYAVKFNEEGDTVWTRVLDGPWSNAYASDSRQDGSGVVFVGAAGTDTSQRCLVLKIDSSGSQHWVRIYDSNSICNGSALAPSPNGGFVIAGSVRAGITDYPDVYVAYTGPEMSIDPNMPLPPQDLVLYQNYPNPFNSETQLSFELRRTARVLLTVSNVFGQRVAVVANNTFSSGNHSLVFSAGGLPSGPYYLRIVIDNKPQVKSMQLLR